MNGAEAMVKCLAAEGITRIFGYPGVAISPFLDAVFQDASIEHILVRQEQAAGHAASGYARITGRPAVCVSSSGPGATNLITALATAYADSIPLIAITGQVNSSLLGRDVFQEADMRGATESFVKYSYLVKNADEIPRVFKEAFYIANSGRKGPVLVDIPKDVQTALCDFEELPPVRPPAAAGPSHDSLQAAAKVINQAQRPFVYFGGGVVSSGAGEEVIKLARRINAPMGCSLMGISGIPTDTPGFLGMEGMHGHFASTKAMNACDCLIALGCRFNDRSTGERSKFEPSGKVVRIDLDSSEFSKTIEDRVDVRGDVRLTLEALLPLVEPNTHEEWAREVRELRAQERGYADYRDTLTPKRIMDAINAHREADMPVVTDVGQHQMWAAQYLSFERPRSFVTTGGLGTMGFGLGASIGAALATGKHVVMVTGDGSFAMNMAELITAVDHHIPVTIVLVNNGVLGMVRQMQSLFMRQRYSSTTLDRRVDYVALTKATGAEARRATTPEELDAALLGRSQVALDGIDLVLLEQ